MNLAVHGLSGDVREGNTYGEDLHTCVGPSTGSGHGKFDRVMANPPFNVSGVDKEKVKDDPRFALGMPTTDNANYLWIQIFFHALNAAGRAGFVMANSAADARGGEMEIRKKLIQSGAVDLMVSIGPNFFYTVTLPCTLWFFDKGKPKDRKDKVLFLDARHIFRQIDRAHRDFTPEQIALLAAIVRLHRGEDADGYTFDPDGLNLGEAQAKILKTAFGSRKYKNVPGLCSVATAKDIEAQGWSLNPGRYVGVAPGAVVSDEDFKEQLEELNEELERLNAEARGLEETIAKNAALMLES